MLRADRRDKGVLTCAWKTWYHSKCVHTQVEGSEHCGGTYSGRPLTGQSQHWNNYACCDLGAERISVGITDAA